MVRDAVFRHLKVIHDSTKQPFRAFKRCRPHVLWSICANLVEGSIDDYLAADRKIVCDEVERRLDNLLHNFEEMLILKL